MAAFSIRSNGGIMFVLLVAFTMGTWVTSAEDFTLTILHTNDIHARIDEFDAKGSRCDDALRSTRSCYGGIARQKYMVDKIRKSMNNTIFLNAGDYYQGTMWFYLLKADIISKTIEFLNHDAMTLGNHEFDDGSNGLLPLLQHAKKIRTPILACNVDFQNNPILREYQPESSIVIKRSGVKIGVIGFLTPDTTFLSNPDNNTVITDDIECVAREAEKLHNEGVKIIIATGHSGYVRDQEIAMKVPLVSVVVGGHSHSYLTSVDQKTGDTVKGPYPTVVVRKDKSRALVVQDFWLGKYLGYINVTFDTDTGMVKSWQGDAPLLLDYTVDKDPEVEQFLLEKRTEVDREANKSAGYTLLSLSGDKEDCRFSECALGNLLADAMTEHFITEHFKKNGNKLKGNQWNPIDIAVVNGGGIRGSIPRGKVTFGDVVTVYPFANTIWVLTMTGAQVKRMYEVSLHRYDPTRLISYGGFLHSSGARIVGDVTRPPFQRIRSVDVLCSSCEEPEWQPLDTNKTYRVAMTSYVAAGGDKHDFTDVPNKLIEKFVEKDTDLLKSFFERKSPVYVATDGRLQLIMTDERKVHSSAQSQLTASRHWPHIALLTGLFSLAYGSLFTMS